MRAADTITGAEVVDPAGGVVGIIADILIDVERGEVAMAIVARSAGAAGGQLVPVPWEALREATGQRRFIVRLSADRFAQAPGFYEAPWPSPDDTAWRVAVGSFFQAASLQR